MIDDLQNVYFRKIISTINCYVIAFSYFLLENLRDSELEIFPHVYDLGQIEFSRINEQFHNIWVVLSAFRGDENIRSHLVMIVFH